MLGFLAAFGVVFLLLGVALRFLKRFNAGTGFGGRRALRLEVVQRVSLSPKQGIAIVRIGERLMAVSMGDGGVHRLAELGELEKQALAEAEAATPATVLGAPAGVRALLAGAGQGGGARHLRAVLRGVAKSAAVVLLVVSVAVAFDAAPAHAQV